MTVKDALQGVYSKLQAHHAAAAVDDQGHSDDCEALAACAKASGDKAAASSHKSMSKRFAESAARHQSDSEAFGEMKKVVASMTATKAAPDPDAIVPDAVKTINPNPGFQFAPRTGQPPLGDRTVQVSPQFEKLVAIEE